MKKYLVRLSLGVSVGLIVSAVWFQTGLVQAVSGIFLGPYVQRVTSSAASILIRTEDSVSVTLFYHKAGAENWQESQDSADTVHRFRLTGLKEGNEYEYYFTASGQRITQTYTFSTKRELSGDDPLRVAVVGDYGAFTTDELRVVTQIMFWNPDILLTTGDNAYESGTLDEFQANVFKPYQPVFAEIPVYPSMGNHDYTTDEGAPYKSVFELPQGNSGNEDYYSFDYDYVHFAVINSNLDYLVGSEQYTWLEGDLAASDAQWKIVYFHHPVFSSGEHGSSTGMDTDLAPLFSAQGVDLVLNGHDHDYERMSKVDGVLYVVTGGGGKSLYDEVLANPYSKYFLSEYHFVGLIINYHELKLKAIDKRGYMFDDKTLSK